MDRGRVARRELVIAVVVGLIVAGALFAMTRVFLGDAWIRPATAAVGCSLLVAASARRLHLPALGSVLLSAVGLALFVHVVHLPGGPLLPGPAQYAAAQQLLADGLVGLRDQPSPTDALPELVFLVTLSTWVVTFVAHELTVRLRRPGLGLVAPTALWVVPLAMPQPAPATARTAVPFLLAAALLLLLESDADLVGRDRERVAPRLTVAGSAVAVCAVAVGALAPGLLPGYRQPPVLDVGEGGSNPRGYQPIVDVGDRLSLPVDRTVLRVESDRRVYLRLAALETFDANTWRLGPPGGGSFVPDQAELFPGDRELRFETPIAEADTTVVDVEVLDLENIYVPVPYQPVEVRGDAAGDMVWSLTGGFLATGELSENELQGTLRTGVVPGVEYEVVSAIPDPSLEQLRAAEPTPDQVAPWLQLPGDGDRWARFAEQAREVYEANGATTSVDRALALQDWFTDTSRFTYALDGIDPLRGPNPLEAFVFDTRTGYCEYFATAMAVMLRASDIPARVAVGFLPGEQVDTNDDGRGVYEVSTSDAHSWVEVLFPGQGWIKFDPTPRSDGSTLAPDAGNLDPLLTPEESATAQEQDNTTDSIPVPDTPDLPAEQPPGAEDATTSAGGEDSDTADSLPVLAIVLVGLVVLAVVGAVIVQRRRRGAGSTGRAAALEAQREVLRTAARLGWPRREPETADEALRRWAAERRCDPAAAAELAVLGQRAAFSDHTEVDGARAQVLAAAITAEFHHMADRRARLIAPLRVPATRVLERAGDAFQDVRSRIG